MDQDISLSSQGGVAVLTVFALNWLKKSEWFPWINANSEKLNRIISIVVAFCTSIGLKIISNQGDMHSGGTLTIAYPPIDVVISTLLHGSVQFGGQEVLHKLISINNTIKKMSEQVQAMQDGGQE